MRRAVGCLVLALLLHAAPAVAAEPAPAPPDSLDLFLRDLSDSTDIYYGEPTARFDTTGLDSLFAAAKVHPLSFEFRRQSRGYPVLRFHRSEGFVLGANLQVTRILGGKAEVAASYGFSNQGGRYEAGYRRTLLNPERGRPVDPFASGRIGEGRRLDFYARYARETVAIMPEHAGRDMGSLAALVSGKSRQSVYETRGIATGLEYWTGDWRFHAGFHHALDQPMPLATEYSFFGSRDSVPENTLAERDEYSEAIGGVAFYRRDWDFGAMIDGRDGGGDRWRLRGAIGKGFRLTSMFHASLQMEAGAAAAQAPVQRRMEIGGPRAIPSSPYNAENGDHLLLGKAELLYGQGLFEMLHIGHPRWMVLQPFGYFQSGAAWTDPGGRDIVFSKPPQNTFLESAGFGLALRAGVPTPDTYFRLYLAIPVGSGSGVPRVRFAIRAPLDLLGKL